MINFTPIFNPYLSSTQLANIARTGWDIENSNAFAAIAILSYPNTSCIIELIGVKVCVGKAFIRQATKNKAKFTNLWLIWLDLHGY